MRRAVIVLVPLVVAASMIPAHAAVTQVGDLPQGADTQLCDALAAVQSSSVGGEYDLAATGVITSWTFEANVEFGASTARAVVYRPLTSVRWTVRSRSAVESPRPGRVTTFPTRLPVAPGDQLGLTLVTSVADPGCWFAGTLGASGDTFRFLLGSDPAVGDAFEPPSAINGGRLDLAAVVEPDADGDRFGDVSQDRCPTQASAGATCDRTAPTTTITRRPPARGTSRQAVFAFRSSESGSTFACSIDGSAFRSCRSPLVRTVSRGSHVFKVRASDRWGNRDSTPAVARWRVT